MEWWVNGEYSSVQRNQELLNSRVQFNKGPRVNGVLNGSVTFPITEKFNSTLLRCIALNVSTVRESSNAVLTIAGMYYTLHISDNPAWIMIVHLNLPRFPTSPPPSSGGDEHY